MPGPAGISSVKICVFQWPLGHCGSWLAGVALLPCPWGGACEGAIVIMFLAELVTSLNYLLTGWLEFGSVLIHLQGCLPL